MKEKNDQNTLRRVLAGLLAAMLLLAALFQLPAVTARGAVTMAELEKRLAAIQKEKTQHQQDLNDAKKKADAAAALSAVLEEQVDVLQEQISVLQGDIASVQNDIGIKELEIEIKGVEIDEKQAEIDDQWEDFKHRMAAMQELREGGSVAMLTAVDDLFQLLTFSEMMQDISVQDNRIMERMKESKEALEQARLDLEAQHKALTEQQNALVTKKNAMKGKQTELNASLKEAQLSEQAAREAQSVAQAALESDEMNYEAVQKQIKQIIAAAAAKNKLSFTGFRCPLDNYIRISSEYGYRVNPVSKIYKLHGGIDFSAAKGTPIYAAADGIVTTAGWTNSGYGNYVIIYHGSMNDGRNYSTLYGHMNKIAVKSGAKVKQGQLIGYVGSTGNSTGNHLHLEVWQGTSNASRVDPRKYIPIPK